MTATREVGGLRLAVRAWKQAGLRVALVPTMGALHAGHLDLVRQARAQADRVVMSIFVNPTQFGPNEDLARYPRPLERDLALAAEVGTDLVFNPTVETLYPGPTRLGISIAGMADHLCGASRPGHFNGVLQVVNKLFNLVQPDVAVFGQKDIQQYRLIETMVAEFDHPIRLVRAATVREPDGLALSSRNVYLSAEERAKAPALFRELNRVVAEIGGGGSVSRSIAEAKARLAGDGFKDDYLEVVDYDSLAPVAQVAAGATHIAAVAQYLGTTRLIDNVIFPP